MHATTMVSSGALPGAAMEMARRHAGGDAPLLISGQAGAGRARMARAVHYLGPRRLRPFIPLHCAALYGRQLEDALPELVRMADGGTLFLDEVAHLPAGGQEALWRLLQARSEPAVRWIAGADDLPARAAAGACHGALLQWLATARIDLPPQLPQAVRSQPGSMR
ncbi:MAG: sigma 54-interacting transcriptional regulator [Pseudorhodoferax sp.]